MSLVRNGDTAFGASAAMFGLASILCTTIGCGPTLSTTEELAAFERAGPILPKVDPSQLVLAKRYAGAYRVVSGDLLEVRMPAVMRAAISEAPADAYERVEPYLVRIESTGDISLPMVGRLAVGGKTLGEIDQIIAGAYHPKYLRTRPSIVARASEYNTVSIAVVGGVAKPGVYELRSDEMSIVALLMKAGGFARDGASVIRIRKVGGEAAEPIILPVKETNIPFADVALSGGETVEVRQIDPEVFTVIGLVNKPGVFPYPPNVQYTLLQGIGYAGGADDIAAPEYATVYRLGADGNVVSAVFRFSDRNLLGGAAQKIRPGDVVSVDQTPETRTRKTLAQVFRVVIGAQLYGNMVTPVGSSN